MKGACQLCMEAITNPICVNCLDRQLKTWFMGNKDYFAVSELRRDMELFESDGANCIICGETSAVCSYCFGDEVFILLKERDVGLSERFRDVFKLRLIKKDLY